MKRALVVPMLLLLCVVGFAGQTGPHSKKQYVSPGAVRDFLDLATPRKLRTGHTIISTVPEGSNVVILEADPELLILSNVFDLKAQSIHFLPTLKGRYAYSLYPSNFNPQATQTIQLKDDASYELLFQSFPFRFGKKTYDRCFVNSNGNITFEIPDTEPPNAENLLKGPPRIAAFFADLDPETSGTVLVHQTSEAVTVTWLKVPEFYAQNQFGYGANTFQIVLSREGTIDLVFSDEITAQQALIGIATNPALISPRMVDFTRGTSQSHPSSSFVENFHNFESIDIPLLMKSLYTTHPDRYDFVTLISNFDLDPVPGTQAFAINVRNGVRGIGDPSEKGKPFFKENDKYGSRGKLQNITFLGNMHQYPLNPDQSIRDLNTSLLQILAHEVAHRGLAYIKLSRDGAASDVLLGRDRSHWSFFFDTEGSFLEGNQIAQKGADSFVTHAPFQGFSDVDLYLMGFLSPQEVRDSFYVESAGQFSPDFPFGSESYPEAGVSFRGTAVPVRIADIIAANGSRRPTAHSSQKEFRHLFVLIVKNERPATVEEIDYVDLLRQSWESFFSTAVRGKAKVDTRIN